MSQTSDFVVPRAGSSGLAAVDNGVKLTGFVGARDAVRPTPHQA